MHWTAGANTPCDTDLKAYHYCVDKYGKIFAGTHKPEDNLNCYDSNYAMHFGGGNTGCIVYRYVEWQVLHQIKNKQNTP